MWARMLGAFSFQLCVAVQKLKGTCCSEVVECPRHYGWDFALRVRWAEAHSSLVRSAWHRQGARSLLLCFAPSVRAADAL